MAKAGRTPRPGMFFVMTSTRDSHPVFEISRVADLFIDTLLHYRTLGYYKLHAYVVMPDHVHLLLTPQFITLDQAVCLIRNGFAHRLDQTLPLWEDNFTAYSIANLHDMEIARAYLHELPVRCNLAPAPELYPYSSAYRRGPIAAMPARCSAARRSSTSASDQELAPTFAFAGATSIS